MNDQSKKLRRRMMDEEQESVNTDLGQNKKFSGVMVTVSVGVNTYRQDGIRIGLDLVQMGRDQGNVE